MITLTRRSAILGVCACGLTACGSKMASNAPTTADPSPAGGPQPVPIADVPVGGSIVVMVDVIYPVVVTRPTSTTFAAHTAICTHQGCTVKPGQGVELGCPCHGSRFDAATGQVLGGPAAHPLRAWPFTVHGDVLMLHAHEDSDDHTSTGSGSEGE